MRTGEDPGNADVVHGSDNPKRDNRMELILYQRKPSPMPRWRRRVRNADGLLVYSNEAMDGVSIRQLEHEQGIKIER
jgi:NAD(P)H-dependent FMN reductase